PTAVGGDLDNVRAALNWAENNDEPDVLARLGITAWVYLGHLGQPGEATRWLASAERASGAAAPVVQAGLLQAIARQELAFGSDRRRAQGLLVNALAILEEEGHPIRA